MKIFLRKLHRWLGLLMALQIVAWMASGFYFSIFPIAEIRGEHLTRTAEVPAMEEFAKAPSPAVVKQSLDWLSVPAKDVAVEWLESEQESLEFRGRQLPVWKVSFSEPESLSLYLDPWTGEILARRTDRWRLFDFLWMLHIMDFDTRDDFNHPLLQVAALLGLIVALSGFVFWALTTRLFRRRRNPGMSA